MAPQVGIEPTTMVPYMVINTLLKTSVEIAETTFFSNQNALRG